MEIRVNRIGRNARGTGTGNNLGGSGGNPVGDPKFTILTVTNSGGGVAVVTTKAAHGLTGGELVTITGTSGGTYDGPWTVQNVPATTTFWIGLYSADSTGGVWRFT